MLDKLISVIKEVIFPSSHLIRFLRICSDIEFESKLSPRPQANKRMFYPYYYKNKFVKDCIIELKERNSKEVAHKFANILARWIIRESSYISDKNKFYLIPVPQHISQTKEKGFCHTTTLTAHILDIIQKKYQKNTIHFLPCITKIKNIKKLHSGTNKKKRFSLIKNSMVADLKSIDLEHSYFFIIDDVYTSGATFKEARRSLKGCGALDEQIFFISIAH